MEGSDLAEQLLTEIVSAADSQLTAAPNWPKCGNIVHSFIRLSSSSLSSVSAPLDRKIESTNATKGSSYNFWRLTTQRIDLLNGFFGSPIKASPLKKSKVKKRKSRQLSNIFSVHCQEDDLRVENSLQCQYCHQEPPLLFLTVFHCTTVFHCFVVHCAVSYSITLCFTASSELH